MLARFTAAGGEITLCGTFKQQINGVSPCSIFPLRSLPGAELEVEKFSGSAIVSYLPIFTTLALLILICSFFFSGGMTDRLTWLWTDQLSVL